MGIATERLKRRIDQGLGRSDADLVIKGARILDVATGSLEKGDVAICGETIVGTYDEYRGVEEMDGSDLIVAPGFIDTHVHVESTLVSPYEFDRGVLPRGTTTAVCDPHEICNVLGTEGLDYFLKAAMGTAMDLRVQLSSCVPATGIETSGASLGAEALAARANHPKVIGLAEFMNYPGIFHHDPDVLAKLTAFEGKHIDGHAPMVTGKELNAYLSCGIRNCHETTSVPEAWEKLRKGMQVLIRDGSVTKDVKRLAEVIGPRTSSRLAFCTDDRNPREIMAEGHLDHIIRTAIASGAPAFDVYRAATLSAAEGFGMRDRGLVAPGKRADLVLIEDLNECTVRHVLKDGRLVTDASFAGRAPLPMIGTGSIKLDPVTADLFKTPAAGPTGPVIGLIPHQVVTDFLMMELPYKDGLRHIDLENDVLKIAVLARHGKNRNVGRGFVKGFGFKRGALASSIGHDSHNVCVVGASDSDMAVAVNRLIELQGGFVAVVDGKVVAELPLPLAGLMSFDSFEGVQQGLVGLKAAVRAMGCPLDEPFLSLAFLPLPVIPHLKITDFGLVDVDNFRLVA
ncbi:adenine deaminase [Lacibacterium aquatile]|uniref:Adenine deaminase n=1 Tax=Lacibacterium aquatile TaxID=1168082 RepID=A0ABW5DWN5_9PROT